MNANRAALEVRATAERVALEEVRERAALRTRAGAVDMRGWGRPRPVWRERGSASALLLPVVASLPLLILAVVFAARVLGAAASVAGALQ